MSDYIESTIGDEGKIIIEVRKLKTDVGFISTKNEVDKQSVNNSFNHGLNIIRMTANSVLETLDSLKERPNVAKIDFAIKFDSESGAMLAKAESTDAQLKISLSWHAQKTKEEKEGQ
ncbi:MAG: hypothetical protein B6242_02415 [Anaerolineaceae bacterium 4572_78]|nr:MAG: hypothetical protein B6242_02415 [Anaerolineaceae bacterium 4572_78]